MAEVLLYIDKLFNKLSVMIGMAGGLIAWIFGGWDILIKVLVVEVVLDYISGLMKAAYLCEISSELGRKGIIKKAMIFIIVGAMNCVEMVIGNALPLREIVVTFFITNEAISLLENAAQMGIPLPEKVKQFLLQLREQNRG